MKRTLILLLAALLAFGTACGGPAAPSNADPEPVQISAFNESGGSTALFSKDDSARILELLENGDWVNDLTDCLSDIRLDLPDGVMRYHSECGTFIDYEKKRSLTLSDEEQEEVNAIMGRYITLGWPEPNYPDCPDNDLGITLTVKDLSPTGCTLVCTQSGGFSTGELQTGSYYVVERLTGTGWEPVEYVESEYERAWTDIAYLVNLNGTTEWEINWEGLYGRLPEGHYRIGKEFLDFRGPGDYDQVMIYAEFSLGQMPIAE